MCIRDRPLVVDNTFATPVNCQPFKWGADIVVHSTTKYMDGHAAQVGGAIVDSGNFDWEAHAEKFPGLTTPDESYHGVVYTKQFGKAAYITKINAQLMRDLGSVPSPMNSFILNLGLESLVCLLYTSRTAQWNVDSNGWWYCHADGSYTTNGWESINGYWYYFNGSGYMLTGWQEIGGEWYYLNADGAMASNTWVDDYYLTASGVMAKNTWIGNYYVGPDGKWVQDTACLLYTSCLLVIT